jgi:ring-1,2-phenylacetyl-CoA epoxidase subunit PaaD
MKTPGVGMKARITSVVRDVQDPEIAITLYDLGVLRSVEMSSTDTVKVVLRPTRLACPARGRMERDVRAAVATVEPMLTVDIEWDVAPWATADISAEGVESLRRDGYIASSLAPVKCPYCGSVVVKKAGSFGGSICRLPWSCRRCGSQFDALHDSADAM